MYYVFNRQGWWIVSTLALFAFGLIAFAAMIRRRSLDPALLFIVLCAVLHGFFALVAPGPRNNHIIYDPLLAAGVLMGLAALPLGRARNHLLAAFLGVSIVAQANDARDIVAGWRNVRDPVLTASLYVDPAWMADWSKVLEISTKGQTYYLSYATGVGHYFPSLQTADVWTLSLGQLLDADKERVLSKLRSAEIVVRDMKKTTAYIFGDADIQRELSSLCVQSATENFQILLRKAHDASHPECDA
jgi:hypothetical protein